MDSWYYSNVTHVRMEGLIKRGLLRGRTNAAEWLMPGRDEAPTSPDGYVVSERIKMPKRGVNWANSKFLSIIKPYG